MNTIEHPTRNELAELDSGKLPEAEALAIQAHLAGCETCRRTLESLPADPLVQILRSLPLSSSDNLLSGSASVPAQDGFPEELAGHPRYELLNEIGSGGMGTVYLATHRLMGRKVALKVIRRKRLRGPESVARFQREVRAAARLDHPNIVRAFDAEQIGDCHFLVMEHVEGDTLDRLVARQGPLSITLACDCIRQAALGLHHAHERGMVHRDIKPSNLIRTLDGTVKILDFGLASLAGVRASDSSPGERAEETYSDMPGCLTQAGMGTPDFIAPEQVMNAVAVDARADVYALGATFYYLLTGRTPFADITVSATLRGHLERDPVGVRQRRADVPAELGRIVERMMAKRPEDRYRTASEVAQSLTSFLHPRRKRSRRWFLGVAAGTAAALLGWTAVRKLGGTRETVVREEELRLALGQHAAKLGETRETVVRECRCLDGHAAHVRAVAFSPDGSLLASGSNDSTARLWDVETGAELHRFEGHANLVTCVAFSPDGRYVLTASWDRTLRLWDACSGDEVARFNGHELGVTSAVFSPSGSEVFSTSDDQSVRSWQVCNGKEQRKYKGHWDCVQTVAVSRDGATLLSGGNDRTLHVWDAATGQLTRTMTGHEDVITDVAFTPDGTRVLSGGFDGTIRVWDLASGEEIRRIADSHQKVWRRAFSADRSMALSGENDGSVRLYRLDGGDSWCFEGHTGAVFGLAFSPREDRIASGGVDGTVRMWKL